MKLPICLLPAFHLLFCLDGRSDGFASGQGVLGGGNRILQTTARCDADNVYFSIQFERPFYGVIYSEGAYSQCLYVNGTLNPKRGNQAVIPLRRCNTRQLTSGAYENSVVVQYDQQVLEATDSKYLINCQPNLSAQTSFTLSFGGVTVQPAFTSTQVVTGAGTNVRIDYTVEIQLGQGPNGPLIRRPLSVGEDIAYVVRVPLLNSGQDVRIGSCWAKDGISTIQLSDERGCSLQQRGNIWNEFQTSQDGRGKVFWNNIRAWAFPTSNRVDIYCNLHVCPRICSVFQCSNIRGKRSAASNSSAARSHLPTILDDNDIADQIMPIEGGFRIGNLKKIDVVNAEFSGLRRNGSYTNFDGSLITNSGVEGREGGGQSEISLSTVDKDICFNQYHFGLGIGLLLIFLCLFICVCSAVTARVWSRFWNAKKESSGGGLGKRKFVQPSLNQRQISTNFSY